MFTDIVGYTALMQSNEKNAISIREKHRKVLENTIQKFNGRILQYYGDGTLTMFGSAVEAVKCSIEIQSEFNSEPKIPVRIGLHLGDVVYQDDGIFGDGVNVAARVEALSKPGAVLVSEKIFDEITNHPDLKAKSVGYYYLKNVQKPLQLFTIVHPELIELNKNELSHATVSSKKSVAVLPFVNMSNDVENEYFSDGITEDILNALSKFNGLKVTARTSSFAFKGKNIDVREIGRQLNVDTVIEGSVRHAGNKVRITAQLIKTNDGYHIWSETYDRDLQDIFAVQNEISLKIAHTLREKLEIPDTPFATETPVHGSMEAYNMYLKAKFHFNAWIPSDVELALKYNEKAIELEPSSALYYAAAAGPFIFLGATGYMNSQVAFPKAKKYALKSLELDNTIPDPHYVLAIVNMFYDWSWDEAEDRFKKALELNPSSFEAHQYYALFLSFIRQSEDAIDEAKKAVNLDPLSAVAHNTLGDVYQNFWQFEDAINSYNRSLELDPNFRTALNSMGWAYFEMGDHQRAIAIFEETYAKTESALKGVTQLGFAYAKTGQTEKALELLERLKERKRLESNINLDGDFAVMYAGLGDYNKTFEYLEKAYNERQGHLLFIRTPHWKDLYDDPRFKDILSRMGLSENIK